MKILIFNKMKKMKINENCIEHIKAYLKEYLRTDNINEWFIYVMINFFLKGEEFLAEFEFKNIIFDHIRQFSPSTQLEILKKIEQDKVFDKIKAIILYYCEDYDILANKVTNLLSNIAFSIK